MRNVFVGLLTLVLAAGFVGCSNRKMEGPKGGPGAEAAREQVEKGAKGSEVKGGAAENTFALVEPKEINVAPSAEASATVSIDRGKNFDQAVTLSFKPDEGLTVVPDKVEIAAGKNKAEVTVRAATDAKVGPHHIEITGTPASGAKTSVPWPVHVTKK